jgi:uncharacterized protein YndB with AHSA1/START domain
MASVKSPITGNDASKAPTESYGVVLEPGTVRLERVLPGPIERVWSYLTDSNLRAKWLARGDMELRTGGRVELHFHHAELSPHVEPIPEKYRDMERGSDVVGRIIRCEPPRILSYSWGEPSGAESEVTFELTPQGRNVLLVVTHRRLEDRNAIVSVAGGWHAHIGILIDVLNEVEPRPFWSTHTRLEAAYEKLFQASR